MVFKKLWEIGKIEFIIQSSSKVASFSRDYLYIFFKKQDVNMHWNTKSFQWKLWKFFIFYFKPALGFFTRENCNVFVVFQDRVENILSSKNWPFQKKSKQGIILQISTPLILYSFFYLERSIAWIHGLDWRPTTTSKLSR